jgi:hypothetical protein
MLQTYLDMLAPTLPAARFFVGHSPHAEPHAVCALGGDPRVYRLDTMISRAFGPKRTLTDRLFWLVVRGDSVQVGRPGAARAVPTLRSQPMENPVAFSDLCPHTINVE